MWKGSLPAPHCQDFSPCLITACPCRKLLAWPSGRATASPARPLRSPLWEDSIPFWVPGLVVGRVLTLVAAGGLGSGTEPSKLVFVGGSLHWLLARAVMVKEEESFILVSKNIWQRESSRV